LKCNAQILMDEGEQSSASFAVLCCDFSRSNRQEEDIDERKVTGGGSLSGFRNGILFLCAKVPQWAPATVKKCSVDYWTGTFCIEKMQIRICTSLSQCNLRSWNFTNKLANCASALCIFWVGFESNVVKKFKVWTKFKKRAQTL